MDELVREKVSGDEVASVIRQALRGEIAVSHVPGGSRWDEDVGDIQFRFGDWLLTFFNDAGELDYCDSAVSPGPRVRFGDAEEWFQKDDEPVRCHLTREEDNSLEQLLSRAP
jgi:hypothetical protein